MLGIHFLGELGFPLTTKVNHNAVVLGEETTVRNIVVEEVFVAMVGVKIRVGLL
jgi:hypothetical protein